MTRSPARLLGVVSALASLTFGVKAHASAKPYKVGDKVKDFALKATGGKSVKLSQFKSKVIVLAFSAAY